MKRGIASHYMSMKDMHVLGSFGELVPMRNFYACTNTRKLRKETDGQTNRRTCLDAFKSCNCLAANTEVLVYFQNLKFPNK